VFLGKNNKPENRKVSETNKEEIQKGNNAHGPENTVHGIGLRTVCDIFVNSHFTLILLSLLQYKRKIGHVKRKMIFLQINF
jgi:hypothetical protein